jgi:methylmalonyl-CoA mutase N-terminal domain/subunit
VEIQQQTNSNRIRHAVGPAEVSYPLHDRSGSQLFWRPYAAISRNRQTLTEPGEWLRSENHWQGNFIVDQLTDIVEEAVYKEFEAISERGGVLGAMDTMVQRGKIQEEGLYYEHKKHDGSLPLIGVNTFLPKEHAGEVVTEIELIRSTLEQKGQQIVSRLGRTR